MSEQPSPEDERGSGVGVEIGSTMEKEPLKEAFSVRILLEDFQLVSPNQYHLISPQLGDGCQGNT